MRNAVLIFVLMLWPLSAYATEAVKGYAPGSLGYLFENCKAALTQSETLEQVHDTYCGAFVEGYLIGTMSVNVAELPPPADEDPCFEDKTQGYAHINSRFCKNLPAFKPGKTNLADLITDIAHLVSVWADMHRDDFHKPVTEVLGSVVQPGALCQNWPGRESAALKVNPALTKMAWKDLLGAKALVSYEGKYERCKADIARAGSSSMGFKATRCGAEILGFVSGLQVTAPLQKSRPAVYSPLCTKQMDRLYSGLNAAKTMCAKPSTNPLTVAKIFTQNFELIRGQPSFWAWLDVFDAGALGAVGYETIYRGFLCRNNAG